LNTTAKLNVLTPTLGYSLTVYAPLMLHFCDGK
jgi:hypothetical protein